MNKLVPAGLLLVVLGLLAGCDTTAKVQVLFVTVDPERDTPQLLAQYVPSFDPGFLGLYGDIDATARTAKEFKVVYQKVAGSSPENYTMDHSAGTYVFDQSGKLRLFISYGQGVMALLHDIRILLAQNPDRNL